MKTRKHISPGEKVTVWLGAGERKLILDLMCLDDEFEEVVRETPPGKPVALTLAEWDLFAGFIAGEANQTPDKKLQKRLDAIFEKIQTVLDNYTDEEPQLKVFDADDEDNSEEMGGDPFIMGLAAQLRESQLKRSGQIQTHRLKLTKPQRDVLLTYGNLKGPLRGQFAVESNGPRTFHFDVVELMALAFAVQTAAKSTSGRTKKTLIGAAAQIAEGFTALTDTMAGKVGKSKDRKSSHGRHEVGRE
jgi:hypothetical protein